MGQEPLGEAVQRRQQLLRLDLQSSTILPKSFFAIGYTPLSSLLPVLGVRWFLFAYGSPLWRVRCCRPLNLKPPQQWTRGPVAGTALSKGKGSWVCHLGRLSGILQEDIGLQQRDFGAKL